MARNISRFIYDLAYQDENLKDYFNNFNNSLIERFKRDATIAMQNDNTVVSYNNPLKHEKLLFEMKCLSPPGKKTKSDHFIAKIMYNSRITFHKLNTNLLHEDWMNLITYALSQDIEFYIQLFRQDNCRLIFSWKHWDHSSKSEEFHENIIQQFKLERQEEERNRQLARDKERLDRYNAEKQLKQKNTQKRRCAGDCELVVYMLFCIALVALYYFASVENMYIQ